MSTGPNIPTSIHVWHLGPFRVMFSTGTRAGAQTQAISFHIELLGHGVSFVGYRETGIGRFLGQ